MPTSTSPPSRKLRMLIQIRLRLTQEDGKGGLAAAATPAPADAATVDLHGVLMPLDAATADMLRTDAPLSPVLRPTVLATSSGPTAGDGTGDVAGSSAPAATLGEMAQARAALGRRTEELRALLDPLADAPPGRPFERGAAADG